jgi:hypothetical protein
MARKSIAKPARKVNLLELASAAWHAIAKVAAKECDRDELVDGSDYDVQFRVIAEVGGETLDQSFSARLSVGHESERAGSAPSAESLLGFCLEKLTKPKREALLAEIEAAYLEGKLPVTEDVQQLAKSSLQRMRASQTTTVRGSVACKAAPTETPVTLPQLGRRARIAAV